MEYDYYPTPNKLSENTKPSLPPRHRSVNGDYSNQYHLTFQISKERIWGIIGMRIL